MLKNILQIAFGLIFLISGSYFASENLQSELYGIAIGIAAALFIQFAVFLQKNRHFLKLYVNALILKPNSEIRLSIAYLFKIECRGKYLLVKNSRFKKDTYQPIGGVYKFFHPEATHKLSRMSIITDNAIENDERSEHDLRLKMSSRKHIRKFIKWFLEANERETAPWREFYEELIASNILPSDHFKYIYYTLVGQDFEPIHKDPYYKRDTFKYVDIYTPRFINQKQKDEINRLLSKQSKSNDFIWVTEAEIRKKFTEDGKRISDHSHKIFFTKKFN